MPSFYGHCFLSKGLCRPSLSSEMRCIQVSIGLVQKCAQSLSHIRLCATPRTAAHQAPLSMGFSRQEYWSGLPCPPPGDLLDPGLEPSLPDCRRILYQLSHQGSLVLNW